MTAGSVATRGRWRAGLCSVLSSRRHDRGPEGLRPSKVRAGCWAAIPGPSSTLLSSCAVTGLLNSCFPLLSPLCPPISPQPHQWPCLNPGALTFRPRHKLFLGNTGAPSSACRCRSISLTQVYFMLRKQRQGPRCAAEKHRGGIQPRRRPCCPPRRYFPSAVCGHQPACPLAPASRL